MLAVSVGPARIEVFRPNQVFLHSLTRIIHGRLKNKVRGVSVCVFDEPSPCSTISKIFQNLPPGLCMYIVTALPISFILRCSLCLRSPDLQIYDFDSPADGDRKFHGIVRAYSRHSDIRPREGIGDAGCGGRAFIRTHQGSCKKRVANNPSSTTANHTPTSC